MQSDIIIIGGGIVGLATALQLQTLRPSLRITVLEKEKTVGAHQSSHNSGVIHSGIYYKPGSLRALNCKRGYELLLNFCQKQDIPFEICGKIIVATRPEEVPRLDAILERGLANGLQGIRRISGAEAREIEPHVRAEAAIWVPQAGIIDYGVVAAQYAELLQQHGNHVVTGEKIRAIRPKGGEILVETEGPQGHFSGKTVVNCGGLYSDKLAALSGQAPGVKILPFRGEYYELKPERAYLVRNLIYPLPNPAFPFLGVHFTRMIQGGIEAGPNAVLAFKREGYSRWDIHLPELAEVLAYPGFRRLARKYWREGWLEMQRSYSKRHFIKALQQLVPDIRPEDVVEGRAGVRAMACSPQGELLDDFLILEQPGVIHVCNAPSPAATASLAVGETVAQKVLRQWS
jgi:(S)-2-hydroxyglutarate dehydrogenase